MELFQGLIKLVLVKALSWCLANSSHVIMLLYNVTVKEHVIVIITDHHYLTLFKQHFPNVLDHGFFCQVLPINNPYPKLTSPFCGLFRLLPVLLLYAVL